MRRSRRERQEEEEEEEMENGNGEGKGELMNQNNDFFLDSMSMLSSLPTCWDPSLPPPPPPPPSNSLFHALTVDASFPDQFHHPQESGGPTSGSQEGLQGQGTVSTTSAPVVRQKPRVRARRGQATDPHSIAERLRRERIAERMKSLQELVPNTNKTDKASMLDEIIEYVRFLQLQVKVLSMSRLGGAGGGAVGPRLNGLSAEAVGGRLNALSAPCNVGNGNLASRKGALPNAHISRHSNIIINHSLSWRSLQPHLQCRSSSRGCKRSSSCST